MLHYFIVNPTAGVKNSVDEIKNNLEKIFALRKDSYIVYETKKENDATMQIKKVLQDRDKNNPNLHIRIYSAGGDGTSYECANGVFGYQNVSFAVMPTGSCNDFLKSFPEYDFSNLENLINGTTVPIDVLKVNDKICINVCNIGYDAKANADCMRFRKKMKSIHKAYVKALAINLLKPLGDMVRIEDQNNNLIYEGKSLLLSFSNGQYYGGGYRCAPLAVCDDGLMEVSVIKKVSRITFLKLVKGYKKGEHIINYSKYHKYSVYDRASKVLVTSPKELVMCIDGEVFYTKRIEIEVVDKAINFVLPLKTK